MEGSEALVLEFGSRSGSWFAFCLFGAILGVLGWGVSREILRRSIPPAGRVVGPVIGWLLFLGPLWLVYASSLSGFYEAEVQERVLRLRYLVPFIDSEIPIAEISAVRPIPSYKGQWRLQLVTASGDRYDSATSQRDVVNASSEQLTRRLALGEATSRSGR